MRNRTRTEARLMLVVTLIELAVIVALGYFLISWADRAIAQVIA